MFHGHKNQNRKNRITGIRNRRVYSKVNEVSGTTKPRKKIIKLETVHRNREPRTRGSETRDEKTKKSPEEKKQQENYWTRKTELSSLKGTQASGSVRENRPTAKHSPCNSRAQGLSEFPERKRPSFTMGSGTVRELLHGNGRNKRQWCLQNSKGTLFPA